MNYKNGLHKPKSEQYTAILEFEVIKPQHELEHVGEKLKLSSFGEYCPERSMRGYQLDELLYKSKNYRVSKIVIKGDMKPFVISVKNTKPRAKVVLGNGINSGRGKTITYTFFIQPEFSDRQTKMFSILGDRNFKL